MCVIFLRGKILKNGDDESLMSAIYQRQTLKLHHGKIQGKKHDTKYNKRTDKR